MLDKKDIDKLIKAFSKVFATKEDFEKFKDEQRKNFTNLKIA